MGPERSWAYRQIKKKEDMKENRLLVECPSYIVMCDREVVCVWD